MKNDMTDFLTRTLTACALLFALFFAFYYASFAAITFIFGFILGRILLLEWPLLCKQTPALWLFTPLYPVLPFTLFILLNESPAYRPLLFILFITVAAHDIGSYIVGKLCGKHRLAPRVSPGKTWEGMVGGFIAVGLCLYAITQIKGSVVPLPQLFLLTTIISLLALSGDLFESWLKRNAGLKDTGTFLPGHGGLLDRFDSSMFVIFFFYFFREYLFSIIF